MNKNNNFGNNILLVLLIFNLMGCDSVKKSSTSKKMTNSIMMTSLASDGHYVVTSDLGKRIILWNLEKKTAKIVANNANVYSAYFIKNTRYYMYQDDKTNNVIINDINNKSIHTFNPGFATYGEAMSSNLNKYLASDEAWNIFLIENNTIRKIKSACDMNGFEGVGKLLNFTLAPKDDFLLTSGVGGDDDKAPIINNMCFEQASNFGEYKIKISLLEGVVLWNLKTKKPQFKFPGNVAKEIATLSPDGKYIVSGDEDDWGFVFNAKTGKKLFQLWSLSEGIATKQDRYGYNFAFNKKGLIPMPADFHDQSGEPNEAIFALKFIDNTHYLRFTTYIPYAILYDVHSPKPKKYFQLGTDPYPLVNGYAADSSIDTSPTTHTLVMAQIGKSDGIIVYHYDSKNETLTKVWAPKSVEEVLQK